MKRYFPVILLLFLLPGCKSAFQSFNEMALTFASNDKRIDEQEYLDLIKEISESEEKAFQQFKNDSNIVDNKKMVLYLLKYFKAKRLNITRNDIWQPEAKAAASPFNINVYLENSKSIDGYVKGETDFETAIYSLLADLKINDGLCDSLNLNYINKTIPWQKKNALQHDIQDFIEKLDPDTFKKRGGGRGTSDLKNILSMVLKKVDAKNAAILVSDFVFSPGKKANAQDYLNNQQIGIKVDFSEKLKELDLAVVIIQLQSDFAGTYFDKMDNQFSLKTKRPYYVWILGSTQQINAILSTGVLDNIKGGYLNRLVFQSIKTSTEPNYKILYSPRTGTFSARQLKNRVISDAAPATDNKNKGLFGFRVAVDFSGSTQGNKFFLDSTNYVINNTAYQLQAEMIPGGSDPSLSGFTHLLTLKTTALKEEVLRIDIVGKTPEWVVASTSTDDSGILKSQSEQQKTFGLKYLVEGVSDAFYPKTKSNAISSITITIKK